MKRRRNSKPPHRSRPALFERLEDRRLLFFHTTGIGGLACELFGEHGRVEYPAVHLILEHRSPTGEQLDGQFRSAVREALGDSFGDTVDKVNVHWGVSLLDEWGGVELGDVAGQTFGYDVYLEQAKPSFAYDKTTTELLVHELVHVRQFERFSHSLSNFGYHYWKEYCHAGFSYEGNDLEEEAYAFADDNYKEVFNALWPTPRITLTGGGDQTDDENQRFTWNIQGRVDDFDVKITRKPSGFVSSDISPDNPGLNDSFDFNDESPADFVLFVEASNRYKSHSEEITASVEDDDEDGPSIVAGPTGTLFDSQLRQFSWNVSDPSGLSSLSVDVFGPTGRLLDNDSAPASGTFNFGAFGPGDFSLRIEARDNDRDHSIDKERNAAYRPVTVVDDDVAPPTVRFFANDGRELIGAFDDESHGLTNSIAWEVTDESGISNVNARLFRDGDLIDQFPVGAVDELNLDSLGLGTFRVELTATDADADGWIRQADTDNDCEGYESCTTVASGFLTVTNEAPTVFAGGPYLVDEGGLLSVSATGSDTDPGDTESLRYDWDLDGDGDFSDASGAAPVLSWEQLVAAGIADDGTYTIRGRVRDTFDAEAIAPALVTVLNVAPQIERIHSDPFIDENTALTVTGSFNDPSPADTHEVRIFWGDGSSSVADVDPVTRTFSGTHLYPDDDPTETPFDEYVIRVEVTDDDGATNSPRSQVLEVTTDSVGSIELPSFPLSLPAGVSGRLESASVAVDPQVVDTTTVGANPFNHTHTIKYSDSIFGDIEFDTGSSSAVGSHTHDFNFPKQTKTFTSSLSNFNSERPITLIRSATETNSSDLPEGHDHQHGLGNVTFNTSTRFTYSPSPAYYASVGSNIVSNPGGESHFRYWDEDIGGPRYEHYSERSLNPPNSSFGAHFFSGGTSSRAQMQQIISLSSSMRNRIAGGKIAVHASAWMGGWRYQDDYAVMGLEWLDSSGRQIGSRQQIVGPKAGDRGSSTKLIYKEAFFNVPTNAYRLRIEVDFYRDGGTNNDGYIDKISVVFKDKSDRYYDVSKSATNGYILPAFSQSRGTLRKAVVSLDAGVETTNATNGGSFDHTHNVALSVAPFHFAKVETAPASAGVDHAHQVDLGPVQVDFDQEALLRQYFLQETNTHLAQAAVLTSNALGRAGLADPGHAHELAAGTVPFTSRVSFTYDVSSTVVRVRNLAPEIVDVTLPASVSENEVFELSGSFSDAGPGDTHLVRIAWGDGTVDELTVAPGTYDFAATHVYEDDEPSDSAEDTYEVQVTVLDDDGGAKLATREIIVQNELPELTLGIPASVDEGSLFELPPTSFTDIGQLDTHTARIEWGDDTDSDANVIQGIGSGIVTDSHVYTDEGVYEIRATLRDDDGGEVEQSDTVTVRNVAPTIELLQADGLAVEGAALSLSASATDPGDDTLTYTWDFGDGSLPVSGVDLTSVAHTYVTEGTYTVMLAVDDGDGGNTSQTLTLVVPDISEAVTIAGSGQVNEGQQYLLALSALNAAAESAVAEWVVDWGDGNSNTYASAGVVSHEYADGDAQHTITVDVNKTVGGTGRVGQLDVEVANVAPQLLALSGAQLALEGDPLNFRASALDVPADPLTFTWDFGDGSAPQSNVDLSAVQHTYANNGTFFVTLTIDDGDGGQVGGSIPVVISDVAPTISLSGAGVASEGHAYELTLGAIEDPGADVVSRYIVDWGDGQTDSYVSGGIVEHTYADGPSSAEIVVSLEDADGLHAAAGSMSVQIQNEAPVITAYTGDTEGAEGDRFRISAAVADPAGAFDVLTYRWDFGDGTSVTEGIDLSEVLHTYVDDGTYSVTLTVSDEDGASSSEAFEIVVDNVAPVTVLSGPATVTEGSLYEINFGPILDPGTDQVSEWIIDWGDGDEVTLVDPVSASHTYADGSQPREIVLTLVDEDGTFERAATLDVEVLNADPRIVTLGGDTTGLEGGTFDFQASATDPAGALDPLTFEWDFGDGTPVQAGVDLDEVTHSYANDGTYTATLTVDDGDGGSVSRSIQVAVSNVAPTIELLGADSTLEGAEFQLTLGEITDPGDDSVTRWLVNWGDGTSGQYDAAGIVSHHYTDGPATHTILVSLLDNDGLHPNVGTHEIAVLNDAPTIDSIEASGASVEGAEVSFSVEATDPAGGLDTLSYTWDFGDGSVPVSGRFVSHVYADDGTYEVIVTVDDGEGGVTTHRFDQLVENVAPTITIEGAGSVPEGLPYELTLGDTTDPGDDTVTEWIVDWGNGHHDTLSGPGTLTHVYPDGPATSTIQVFLVDEDGTHLAGEREVVVRNRDPEITSLSGDDFGEEGMLLHYSATAEDPAGDSLTFVWDFGDGSDPVSGVDLDDVSHVYADDGDYLVQLSVLDEDGGQSSLLFGVHIHNEAPTLDAGADQIVHEGELVSLDPATFNDLGTLDTHTATINWGDGSPVVDAVVHETPFGPPGATAGASGTIEAAHVYPDNGVYTVTLSVVDDDGGTVTDTFQVTVNNVAPELTVVDDQEVSHGLPFSLTDLGAVTDPGFRNDALGTVEEFSFSIDWGDNTPADTGAATIDGLGEPGTATAGTFDGSHVYAVPGIYDVSVTVTDDDGGAATELFQVTAHRSIFVLDPAASGALSLDGNAIVEVPGGVFVHSTSSRAVTARGNAIVSAATIEVAGGVDATGSSILTPDPIEGGNPPADPLAHLVPPEPGEARGAIKCNGRNAVEIQPGVYDSITATGNCQLTLMPGVYTIAGGDLQIAGGAIVAGDNVVIYNAGSNYPDPGGKYGDFQISGQATVNLAAPTEGPYSGILLFQARDNDERISLGIDFTTADGLIYAPAAELALTGNAQLGSAAVVQQLKVSGNAASRLSAEELLAASATVPVSGVGPLLSNTVEVAVLDSDAPLPADGLPLEATSAELPSAAVVDQVLAERGDDELWAEELEWLVVEDLMGEGDEVVGGAKGGGAKAQRR